MPLIKAPIPDKLEDAPVPEGRYSLRVTSFTKQTSEKTGREGFLSFIRIEDTDYPNASSIRHSIWLPKNGDESDYIRRSMRDLSRFLTVVGVEHEVIAGQGIDFEPEDVPGSEFDCNVALEHDDYLDDEVNALRLPRLKE